MKKISCIILAMALLGTTAFKLTVPKNNRNDCTGMLFFFTSSTNGVNEFIPSNYTPPPAGFQAEELPTETTSCPGAEVMCSICVPSNLIYPNPNPANSSYAGKPKTDVGNVKAAIQNALANPILDGQPQTLGSDIIIVYLEEAPR